jgi:hypothetical protein
VERTRSAVRADKREIERPRADRGTQQGRSAHETVAGELKNDPQFEAQLRTRAKELGIESGAWLDRVMEEKNIEWAIQRGPNRGGYERDDLGWSL